MEMLGIDMLARATMAALAEIPNPATPMVPSYISLFRQKQGGMDWVRRKQLVVDLAELIKEGVVSKGEAGSRLCPPKIWADALEQILLQKATINLPLTNHTYLARIAWGLADKAAADAEALREEHRTRRYTPPLQPVERTGTTTKSTAEPIGRLAADVLSKVERARIRAEAGIPLPGDDEILEGDKSK